MRLPYELLRKNFRTAHFSIEKESASVRNMLRDAAKGTLRDNARPEDAARSLDAMLVRMRSLQNKLVACAAEEDGLYRQLSARTRHLVELRPMRSVDDVAYDDWSRRRLDRLLIDYLLRSGHGRSAECLADERGMRDLVDIDTFTAMSRVRHSLEHDHSATEALAWCAENKKELRRMGSRLEFMLRCQQYIEMVRTSSPDRLLEVIAYAKRFIVPMRTTYPVEVGHMAGLLAYRPDTKLQPYATWYSQHRWTDLADLFVTDHHRLLGLPSVPLLHTSLSLGMSSLKTVTCHGNVPMIGSPSPTAAASLPQLSHQALRETSSGAAQELQPPGQHPRQQPAKMSMSVTTNVCPICSAELNELARHVPLAHQDKSHLEHDLLLLPNGRAYGRERLIDFAIMAGFPLDEVRDLVTGDVFSIHELKKVFIT